MVNLGRKLRDEIQLPDLSWRSFIQLLTKSVNKGFVIHLNNQLSFFKKISEMLDSQVNTKKFSIISTVIPLNFVKFLEKECNGFIITLSIICSRNAPTAKSEVSQAKEELEEQDKKELRRKSFSLQFSEANSASLIKG